MLRFLKAILFGLFPVSGVTRDTSVRELWSLLPGECRLCGQTVVGYRYDIPDWYRLAAGFGPFHNDLHCPQCHHRQVQNEGHCIYCHQDTPPFRKPKFGPDDGDMLG